MAGDRGDPSALRWLIGSELQNARKRAGVSQKEAGRVIGVSHVTISYMEAGTTAQEPTKITRLLEHYGSGQAHIDRLARLAGAYADAKTWWADYADVVPDWMATLLGLEGLASEEFVYEPMALAGMLQTPEYAEALLVDNLRVAAMDVPQVVDLRTMRQERLTGPDPLRFVTVIEEATLGRMVGGPDVMRRQYEDLLRRDSQPNIDLYVMPSSVAVHPGLDGEFTLLDFREAQSIGYVEIQDGAVYIQDQDRVRKYNLIKKRLCSKARPAAEMIRDRLDQLAA